MLAGAFGCLLAAPMGWSAVDHALHSGGPGHETDGAGRRLSVDPGGVVAVDTAASLVALTLDDGPDPRFTPQALAVLRDFGVHATFFLVGRNAAAHPGLVERIVRDGHAVANHTQDHLWLDRQSSSTIRDQVSACEAALRPYGGNPDRLIRPPRGWTSPALAATTARMGLRTAFWSHCVEAYVGSGSAESVQELVGDLGPGAVVLAHDGGRIDGPNPQDIDRSATIEALPDLLEGLRRRSLAVAPLHVLLAHAR